MRAALATMTVLLLASQLGCASAIRFVQTPDAPFDAALAPAPPDYADPESWAALPGRDSAASEVPPESGARDEQATAAADVFYLHPTTFFGWPARPVREAFGMKSSG